MDRLFIDWREQKIAGIDYISRQLTQAFSVWMSNIYIYIYIYIYICVCVCVCLECVGNRAKSLDKMVDVIKFIFIMEIVAFVFQFQWRWGIIWTNDDLFYCSIHAPLDHEWKAK